MLTPLATLLSTAVTMFTPLAELSELPEIELAAVSLVVTVEPATAIELLSVWPAVMLFIWLSVISCALDVLLLELLLWAAAIPAARKDAVMRVQTILFTKFLHICVV